jgi:PleD family two-component response regulator
MNDNQVQPSKGNILVVDDTPDNLRLLSAMLAQLGYEVRRVINGQTALKTAQAAPPDLILLDIMMPDMNGYEVCQHLKASEYTRDIPVIFISALDEVLDKVKAFAVGGVDYITKPFSEEEVFARVETNLTIQRLQKQVIEKNERLSQEIRNREAAESALRFTQFYLDRSRDCVIFST